MEPISTNSDFLNLVKATMNAKYSVALELNSGFNFLNNNFNVGFDLADTSSAFFIKFFELKTYDDRKFVNNEIEKNKNAVTRSPKFKSSKNFLGIIFEGTLSDIDRKYYSEKHSSTPNLIIEFLDRIEIIKYARQFNIDTSAFSSVKEDLPFKEVNKIENESDLRPEEPPVNLDAEIQSYTRFLEQKDVTFYAVSTRWFGLPESRILSKFLEESIWESNDRTVIETVRNVKQNDILILNNEIQIESAIFMQVKYLGRVISNFDDGVVLNVEWLYPVNVIIPNPLETNFNIQKLKATESHKIISRLGGLDTLIDRGLFDNKNQQPLKNNTNSYLFPSRSEAISTDYSKIDSLNFTKDVQSLAALIALKEMKPPLAIALFGKWGSGKSFFMDSLEQKIRELSKYQGFVENEDHLPKDDDNKIFLEGIAHIRFNAWSYLDANLWAGLAHSLFEKLNQYIKDNTRSDDERRKVQEKITQRVEFLKKYVDQHENKKEDLEERKRQLEKERNHRILKFFKPKYDEKIRKFLKINGMDDDEIELYLPSKLRKYVDKSINLKTYLKANIYQVTIWFLAIIIMIWIVIGFIMPFFAEDGRAYSFINSSWTFVSLNILPVLSFVFLFVWKKSRFLATLANLIVEEKSMMDNSSTTDDNVSEIEKVIRQLNEKITTFNKKIQNEEDKRINLTELAIENLISDAPINDNYLKHLGIITTIRKDFETLSELFADKDKEISNTLNKKEKDRIEELNKVRKEIKDAFNGKGNRKLDRIVLYIDDLDRCSDKKVLEVLQAVHLLMAFPLFTVVVGVDERSVHNALKYQQLKRYQGIEKDLVDKNIKEIEPREYLEKIFQIPFQLPEASEEGVFDLINDIIPFPAEDTVEVESDMKKFELGATVAETLKDKMFVNLEGKLDSGHSELIDYKDSKQAMQPQEIRITIKEKQLLQLFSQLVGNNPRTIKRFINIFRIVKTHEREIFDSEKNKVVVAFMIAFLFGENRKLANKYYYGAHGERLNQFLSQNNQEILNLIQSWQQKEKNVTQLLNMEHKAHKVLLKFVERFSYKLDSQETDTEKNIKNE